MVSLYWALYGSYVATKRSNLFTASGLQEQEVPKSTLSGIPLETSFAHGFLYFSIYHLFVMLEC